MIMVDSVDCPPYLSGGGILQPWLTRPGTHASLQDERGSFAPARILLYAHIEIHEHFIKYGDIRFFEKGSDS